MVDEEPELREGLTDGQSAEAIESAFDLPAEEISSPENTSGWLEKILTERQGQRKIILWYSLGLTVAAFLALMGLVFWQAAIRSSGSNATLFPGKELEVLSVAVFGQIIGVIYIITRSLWDDKNYIEKMT